MSHTALENIDFTESYLVGWDVKPEETLLFVQILLLERHLEFRSYDEKKEFGCYRLAVVRFRQAVETKGIEGRRFPKRARVLDEFEDIDEIESVAFSDGTFQLFGDQLKVEIAAPSVDLVILPADDPDAFRAYSAEASSR
jgi:hypothetical protein